MSPVRNWPSRWSASLVAITLVFAACNSDTTDDATVETGREPATAEESMTVPPDYGSETLVVNVAFTDEGFEPSTIFLPAGRHIKLVLRNRGMHEHHYRVIGLIPSDLLWYQVPEIGEDELLAMSEEELAALDVGYVDDVEHVLHHLTPQWVPFKAASLSGIRPLGNEVHGYAQAGSSDVLTFFPLNTGTFVVEDVRHPEITGTVVVFYPTA